MGSAVGTHGTDESNGPGEGAGAPVISDVGFVKLGGVAELVAVLLVVVSLGVTIVAGLPQPNPAAGAMGEWLAAVDDAGATYLLTSWLFVIDHVLEIVFVVALYHLLREAGGVMRFALFCGVLGLFTVALSGVVELGLVEYAGSYTAAGEGVRSGILATALTLEHLRIVLNVTGTILAWGVGGALFSLAIVRSPVLSDWLGWLGLVFALVVWLNALQLVSSTFAPALLVMLIVGLVWLPSMGYALLRIDPERVP